LAIAAVQELFGVGRSGKCQAEFARGEERSDAHDRTGVHGAFSLGEQQSQGLARSPHPRLGQLPPLRPLPAVRALKKQRARISAHLEIVPAKEAAPDEFPHVRPLYIHTRAAARTFADQTENYDTSIAGCINGSRIASTNSVRIRIIRQPSGAVDGVSLRDYDMGRRYDLPSCLAQYLMAQGFGFLGDAPVREVHPLETDRSPERRRDVRGCPPGIRMGVLTAVSTDFLSEPGS
jgi:hypothetical protein